MMSDELGLRNIQPAAECMGCPHYYAEFSQSFLGDDEPEFRAYCKLVFCDRPPEDDMRCEPPTERGSDE